MLLHPEFRRVRWTPQRTWFESEMTDLSQITFRQMEPSAALEARMRDLAQRLDRYSSLIMGCHVTINAPYQHHHQGKLYEVHINLTVPGREIVASKQHHEHHSHEDAFVAKTDNACIDARRDSDNFHCTVQQTPQMEGQSSIPIRHGYCSMFGHGLRAGRFAG
jgi:ribosome-associated translation inhibitor RaiA